MDQRPIPLLTLRRMPEYLRYLKSLPPDGAKNISATAISGALHLNDVQVRKDLAAVSSGGKPKIGYMIEDLIQDIEQRLGYDSTNTAVLVGVGNLGRALLSYGGFRKYGLEIVAAFDSDTAVIGKTIGAKRVMGAGHLRNLCERMQIKLGVIAVTEESAQAICDELICAGVRAIWNFVPVHLNAPQDVLVQNEDMAYSLSMLSQHLTENIRDDRQ